MKKPCFRKGNRDRLLAVTEFISANTEESISEVVSSRFMLRGISGITLTRPEYTS
jgi:hypothetical protein